MSPNVFTQAKQESFLIYLTSWRLATLSSASNTRILDYLANKCWNSFTYASTATFPSCLAPQRSAFFCCQCSSDQLVERGSKLVGSELAPGPHRRSGNHSALRKIARSRNAILKVGKKSNLLDKARLRLKFPVHLIKSKASEFFEMSSSEKGFCFSRSSVFCRNCTKREKKGKNALKNCE